MASIISNPNLMFKWGEQGALNSIIDNRTGSIGTFYLTQDTHRLYVGLPGADGKADVACVGETIIKVDTIDSLPKAKEFTVGTADFGTIYYVKNINVLCIRNEDNTGWVQINPDTNTRIYQKTNTEAATAAGFTNVGSTGTVNGENAAIITTKIQEEERTASAGAYSKSVAHSVKFTIGAAHGINVSVQENSDNNPVVVIEAEKYETTAVVTDNGYEIQLNGPTDTSYNVNAGKNVTFGDRSESGGSVSFNKATDKIVINASDTVNTGLAIDAQAEGYKFTLTSKDTLQNNAGPTITQNVNPEISYGYDVEKSQAGTASSKFVNNVAALDIYTRTEVDKEIDKVEEKMRNVNAMVYQGVVYSSQGSSDQHFETINSLTTLNKGDTYKVGESFTLESIYSTTGEEVKLEVGDLIIANGTEDSYGHITLNTLKWDTVLSGDELYTLTSVTHGFKLTDSGLNGKDIGTVALKEGLEIVLTDKTATEGTINEITVAHANIKEANKEGTDGIVMSNTPSQETSKYTNTKVSEATIKVVSGVDFTSAGHVKSITLTDHVLRDTNGYLDSTTDTVTNNTNNTVATVANTTILKNYSGAKISEVKTSHTLETTALDNLAVKANNGANGIVIGMYWGTF